jgi:hypothetical protein
MARVHNEAPGSALPQMPKSNLPEPEPSAILGTACEGGKTVDGGDLIINMTASSPSTSRSTSAHKHHMTLSLCPSSKLTTLISASKTASFKAELYNAPERTS